MLFYKIISWIAAPFCFIYFLFGVIKRNEIFRIFERLGIHTASKAGKRYFWIHAVSVGEVSSIINFVKYVKQINKDVEFIVTTGTFSGAKLAADQGFIHQYVPMDIAFCVKNFLKYWNPELVFFVDSEIWPSTISILKEKNIPTILLNSRLSKKSFSKWQRFPEFFKEILEKYTLILPQSATEYSNFSFFGTKNIIQINNLKYSVPPKQYQYKKPNRLVFIAASTHRGEEEIIINVHKELIKKYPTLLTIIAPRHPERVNEITGLLDGVEYSIRTETKEINDNIQVYIANTIGELDFFYHISDIAFVGGSLVNIGGHNIFEPAIQKCAVIHGNYMSNFFDMSQYFAAVMYQVSSGDEMVSVIESLLSAPETLEYIKSQTFKLSQELNKNVIQSVYGLIKQHVKESVVLV